MFNLNAPFSNVFTVYAIFNIVFFTIIGFSFGYNLHKIEIQDKLKDMGYGEYTNKNEFKLYTRDELILYDKDRTWISFINSEYEKNAIYRSFVNKINNSIDLLKVNIN